MTAPLDPVIELVRSAMSTGVMMALENRGELIAKLQALGPGSTLADALTSDAESFVQIRQHLVEAIR